MTRNEIMDVARKHDPDACWASDDVDENCLLVTPDAVVFLLDRDHTAYEDPNPPGVAADHTRVVFPTLDASMTYEDRVEYLRDAEGDEDHGPLPLDAPGCFRPDGAPYTAADFLRSPLAPQLADDPRDARYPGRMSAHPGPDESIF